MNDKDIIKYAGLMKNLGLTGLEITDEGKTVRLERAVPSSYAKETIPCDMPFASQNEAKEDDDYISIKSPMVGVFYSSPAENADPYVSVGDKIEKGKIICIVEAMKLINEIPSDIEGTIEKICVADGQNVEYGTELFRVKR